MTALQVRTVVYFIFWYLSLCSSMAVAAPLIRSYSGYWSGIHVADLVLAIDAERCEVYIDSYGLARTLSKYRSTTATDYRFHNNQYAPLRYQTSFEQRHGHRSVLMTYRPSGQIIHEEVTPPDKAWKRPKVPDSLKKGALDPLTTFLVARQSIRGALAEGKTTFTLSMYDGRSLSAFDIRVYGHLNKNIRGTSYPVIAAELQRRPVAGFTTKELSHMKKEDPKVTIYFSDDATFLPLKIEADAPIGTAVLFLEKTCDSLHACLPGDGQAPKY